MKIKSLNKENIITIIFIIATLAGYVFFPSNGIFQFRVVALIFLVVLPFLYNKYFLKKNNIFKRIVVGDWKNGVKLLAIGLLISFFIAGIVFYVTQLQEHYLLPSAVKNNFVQFLFYELISVAFTVTIYELFFRGFVMIYFREFFDKWSVLIQMVFFLAMIFMLQLPYWFYVTYLIFTPFAGWIAYKSNSILYSFVGQLFFILIFDATYIALTVK